MEPRLWLAVLLILIAAPALASRPVGEATVVIGEAQRVDANGQAHTLTAGSQIGENDRIETGPSSHVHVRFVDQAFVSVRNRHGD